VSRAAEQSTPGPGESDSRVDEEAPEEESSAAEPPKHFARIRGFLTRHEFLSSVMKVMSGTGVAQIIAMVATVYVTHRVAPAEWGTYAAIMAVAQFVIPVAALRYDMAIVLPHDDGEAKRVFKLATIINAVMSVLATIVMIPVGGLLAKALEAPQARWWMLAVGPIIFTFAELAIVNYWANRRKRFGVIGTNAVWNQSVTAAGRFAAAFAGLGGFGQLAATFVGELAALNNFRRRLGADLRSIPESDTPMRLLLRKYIKMPLLTAPNAIVDALRLQGINLSIGLYFSRATLGTFNMAWSLMQVPASVINSAMSQVFFQKLSVTDAGRMYRSVKASVVRSALIGVVPFALLYFLIPPVLPWLLGAKYAQSAPIAVALVPWLFVNFITSPISNMFIVTRNNGIALAFAVVYAAAPLSYLALSHHDIVKTVYVMSFMMAGLLLIYIGLALLVARRFDRTHGGTDGTDAGGDAGSNGGVEAATLGD
jgi:O-antigen/teichoic acid export membrane protein